METTLVNMIEVNTSGVKSCQHEWMTTLVNMIGDNLIEVNMSGVNKIEE